MEEGATGGAGAGVAGPTPCCPDDRPEDQQTQYWNCKLVSQQSMRKKLGSHSIIFLKIKELSYLNNRMSTVEVLSGYSSSNFNNLGCFHQL